jgi:hypothetical protein
MKGYTVFNVEQIDGLPTHYYAKPARATPTVQRNERIERFFAATRADICHGGDRAYYACHTDHIQMPPLAASATRKANTRPSPMRKPIMPPSGLCRYARATSLLGVPPALPGWQ